MPAVAECEVVRMTHVAMRERTNLDRDASFPPTLLEQKE